MPEFPPEIVSDILSLLPAKSLLRFRCASKPYRDLIDGPDFIKLHLRRSVHRRSLILRDCYLYSVDLDSLDRAVELDHPLKSPLFGTDVLGSCNGLLCLSNSLEMDGEGTVIWNMATREHRKVPATRIEFPKVDCFFGGYQFIVYGLGYDSVSEDHKLVRIVQFYGGDFDSFQNEVKIYSVRSNSWRRIGDFPYYIRFKRTWGQFAGGALHWVVSRRAESDTESLIGAVDLGVEGRYRLVPKPEGLVGKFHMNVGVFEGCLSMICNYYQVRVDVWVMREYGVRESWSKLVSIGQPKVIRSFEFLVPLVRRGDRVLLNQDGEQLLWYDLGTKKAKKAKVRGLSDSMYDMEVYQDSLVRLGGGNRVAEGSQAERRRKKNLKKKNKKRDNVESEWNKMVLNNSGEVVTEILSKLPVKTLLRLKCVCKPWCTLIDDSNFIKRHLKTSMESSTNLSLIIASDYNVYSVDLNSFDKAVNLNHPGKYLSCGTEVLGEIQVLGSCNGLLCFCNLEKEILLWNPSTGKYQDLSKHQPTGDYYDFTLDPIINYGFGYDSAGDDYKVVRIAQFIGDVKDSFINEVEVYSLKTNSWRTIHFFPYYICYEREWGVFAGGALHWVVTKRPDSATSALIVAFDLEVDQCREVPMPTNLDKAVSMNLAVLGGNLCLLCNYHTVRVDMWAMKDYGVRKSWTRLFSITRPRVLKSLQYVKPLVYSNSGNEVLLECNNEKFLWYDLVVNKVKDVKLPSMPYPCDGVICVESLVPLGGRDRSVGKQKEAATKNVKKRDGFLSSGFKLVL